MDDRNFKLIVAAGGAILVGLLTFVGFCGTLSLPAKPAKPAETAAGRASDVLTESSATPAAWRAYLEQDARTAGVKAPDPAKLARAFRHQLDTSRRALALGDSVETAGLRLTVDTVRDEDGDKSLVLEIENLGKTELAYQILTRPSVGGSACSRRKILLYDAMVVGPRRRERRSECKYTDGMKLDIERVETLELPPLSAWYVSRLPPSAVTVETRLTKGHKPLGGAAPCNVMMSQAIRSGLETGKIEWRDLVDFFARHRCDTYQFPQQYKAFKKDNERALPAVSDTP